MVVANRRHAIAGTKIDSNLTGSLLVRLRDEFGCQAFIETGTADGPTAELAALAFGVVYTIEWSPEFRKVAETRLHRYPNVRLCFGDSAAWLRDHPPGACELPRIYWLDAHWSGSVYKPDRECPLLDELAAIGSLRDADVVLVDDARRFRQDPGPPHDPRQWPSYERVFATMEGMMNCRQVQLVGDVIVATAREIDLSAWKEA